jgi:hypothetical protein
MYAGGADVDADGLRQRAVDGLRSLPPAHDRLFASEIRALVDATPEPEQVFMSVLADRLLAYDIRFAALYAVLLRQRREERFTDYRTMVGVHEAEFGGEPYFLTFRAIAARAEGASLVGIREAVEYTREADRSLPDTVGILHQLAAFTADYFERLGESADEPSMLAEIAEAERCVTRAITLSHGRTGHYFETRARLFALRGDFVAARAAVARAIEVEDRSSRDYYRRLVRYESTRTRIDLLQQRARLKAAQVDFRAELAKFRLQQLELLGLLAAIVAFVASAANIANQVDGVFGLRIMTVMAGSVVLVFSTFALVSQSAARRVVPALVLGVLLILLGLISPDWLVTR